MYSCRVRLEGLALAAGEFDGLLAASDVAPADPVALVGHPASARPAASFSPSLFAHGSGPAVHLFRGLAQASPPRTAGVDATRLYVLSTALHRTGVPPAPPPSALLLPLRRRPERARGLPRHAPLMENQMGSRLKPLLISSRARIFTALTSVQCGLMIAPS